MHTPTLSAIDLNLLVVLDALLTTRSTTLAARRVALSQPATSHALGRLRELLGDPLLVRAGRALEPTPFALALAPRVTHALDAVRAVLAEPVRFDPRTAQRAFTIGAGDYATSVLLPRLARSLARVAPRSSLFVRPTREPAHEALHTGEVELSLSPPVAPESGLLSEVLWRDRFVCVLRRGHPLARGGLDLARFAALGHVLVAPRGADARGAVDDALAEHGLTRRVAVAVPHFLAAPAVVAQTDYVLTLAERVARTLGPELGLLVREPPLALPGFEMAMHWHARNDADPAHAFLRARVRSVTAPLRPK